MSTDELKLITDMLQSLGQAGTTGFIWWLVLDKVVPILTWLATLGLLLKYVARPVATSFLSHLTMRELRDKLEVGEPGELSPAEIALTKKELFKLISEHSRKN